MQRVEQGERDVDWRRFCISEFGPELLLIGLDSRVAFGERQLESNVSIHVTIRNVMHHLAHCPSAGPVRCIQPGVWEPAYHRSQICRNNGDLVDVLLFLLLREWSLKVKLANGIAEVRHFASGIKFGV